MADRLPARAARSRQRVSLRTSAGPATVGAMAAAIVSWSLTTWTALTAVGTIGAVLVALFNEQVRTWRARRERPDLALAHSLTTRRSRRPCTSLG